MLKPLLAFALALPLVLIGSSAFAAETGVVASAAGQWRSAELEIAAMINRYRAENGLPPVPLSPSMQAVAQAHAADLSQNHPDRGVDARGKACNAHSWSAKGAWNGGCYPEDHWDVGVMWKKPAEITGGVYTGYGYEIAFGATGAVITPEAALEGWRGSPGHNAVLVEQETWRGASWQAMGVGVRDGWAVVWFGKQKDPAAAPGQTASR
jgi:uncharacterized protein YkwD